MPSPFRDPELRGLGRAERRLGSPIRLDLPRPLVDQGDDAHRFSRNRIAEVLLVFPRPQGLLFHTKSFYPPGVWRLPSGGVRRHEAVDRAAEREAEEETGLRLAPVRFLFHLIQHLTVGSKERAFHTLAFLFAASTEPVAPSDPVEQISALRVFSWDEIPAIVQHLETLAPPWEAWGRFRAAPHHLLLEVRAAQPEWFSAPAS